MKEPQRDLDSIELTKIIRSLMHIIVIDSKKFINEKEKAEYIRSYIYIFSKSINGMSDFINMKLIHDQIDKDILNLDFKNVTRKN